MERVLFGALGSLGVVRRAPGDGVAGATMTLTLRWMGTTTRTSISGVVETLGLRQGAWDCVPAPGPAEPRRPYMVPGRRHLEGRRPCLCIQHLARCTTKVRLPVDYSSAPVVQESCYLPPDADLLAPKS